MKARRTPGQAGRSSHQQGFTLLEVMVALAILAVVAVAASQASRSYLQSVANLKTRTLAQFVANNALTDLRTQQTWLNAPTSSQVDEQGRRWQVTVTPMPMGDTLERVQIAVAPLDDGSSTPRNVVTLEAVLVRMQ